MARVAAHPPANSMAQATKYPDKIEQADSGDVTFHLQMFTTLLMLLTFLFFFDLDLIETAFAVRVSGSSQRPESRPESKLLQHHATAAILSCQDVGAWLVVRLPGST